MGNTFGQTLRNLREQAGLTQQELADRASLHRFGVAKLEQGLREPTWATVRALAKALGVTCTAFDVADDEPTTDATPRPRGRPPKAEAAPEPTTKPKRKRKE